VIPSILQPTPQLDSILVRFLSTLEEMIRVHQRLLTLLQREKCLIIDGSLDELTPCLSEKEEVLRELKLLEERRLQEAGSLGRSLRSGDQPLRFKQLVALVPESYQDRLRSCRIRLEALTAGIVEINQMNGILIDRTLQQITTLMGLLRHLMRSPSAYEATGCLSDRPASGRTIGKG
jgi:flagellar biosynthesis/type III secretory pathway chaperone